MKVTIVPIVIGALGTVTKGLLKGLEDLEVGGRVETIKMTALLRKARTLRRVLETCCRSNSSEKPSANNDVKNSKGVNKNSSSSKERRITASRNNTNNTMINRTKTIREWEEKQMYGYFKRQTSEISYGNIWTWLRKRNLKEKLF